MTATMKERIYREVELSYLTQDAENHCSDYLERYDIRLSTPLNQSDYKWLAETFRDEHDCNIADNDLWENIIEEYITKLGKDEITCAK